MEKLVSVCVFFPLVVGESPQLLFSAEVFLALLISFRNEKGKESWVLLIFSFTSGKISDSLFNIFVLSIFRSCGSPRPPVPGGKWVLEVEVLPELLPSYHVCPELQSL